METKDKIRIIERQRVAWQGMYYSIQRIDLLLVALCGGGIYVCLETIKYLADIGHPVDLLVKLAGGMFLFGIITNLIGQMYGQKANCQDYLWCESRLDDDPQEDQDKFDQKSDLYSNLAKWLDYASMAFTGIGLLSVMYYFIFTF